MADVKWFKLYTDFLDNRKIKQIRQMPDAFAIIFVWIGLLTVAAESNENGFIYFTKDIPYTDQLLANQFDVPIATVQLALTTFERFGMIEIINDIICVSNWAKYQNADKMADIKEYNRLAKQKQREKQRLLAEEKESNKEKEVYSLLPVEKDKEEKQDIVNDMSRTSQGQKKKSETINDVFCQFSLDEEVKDALYDFIDMRKQKKRPLTPRALKMVINKLQELSKDSKTQVAIVNQTILHNWDTVYALKSDYGRVGANGIKLSAEQDHTLDGIF